jgi:hypothetical protein
METVHPQDKGGQLNLRSWVDRPAGWLVLSIALFSLHVMLVYLIVSPAGPYRLDIGHITIPDFAKGINDADSPLVRLFYRLNGWDGQWYHHIAAYGYQCSAVPKANDPQVCNVAFFPLVPLLGRLLSLAGIDLVFALPLVSQAFYLGSIMLLLHLARGAGPFRPIDLAPVLLLMSYPGALYFFTPYSESALSFLAIAAFVAARAFLRSPGLGRWTLLSLVCALASLSKVTGVMVCSIPVLMALFSGSGAAAPSARVNLGLLAAGMAGSLGLVAYLLYCQVNFGRWDLYFLHVGSAWSFDAAGGMQLNPLARLAELQWLPYPPRRLSDALLIVMPAAIVLLGWVAWRDRRSDRAVTRAAFCLVVVLYYFYSSLPQAPVPIVTNLIRHLLSVVALMAVMLSSARPRRPAALSPLMVHALVATGIVIAFVYQVQMLVFFRHGAWVS